MATAWPVVFAALLGLVSAGWQDDVQPKRTVFLGDDQVMRFHGNTSHRDHFKLLEMNGDFLLVGARNIVYNISIHNMTENPQHRMEWYATSSHRDMCLVKGKTEVMTFLWTVTQIRSTICSHFLAMLC